MKSSLTHFLIACLLTTTRLLAQSPTTAPADPELKAIVGVGRLPRADELKTGSKSERMLSADNQAKALLELVRPYVVTHPSGEGRAQAVMAAYTNPPTFIATIDPKFDQEPNGKYVIYDQARREAHRTELVGWLQSVHDDDTVSAPMRLRAGRALAYQAVRVVRSIADAQALQERLGQLFAEGLESETLENLEEKLLLTVQGLGDGPYDAILQTLAQSPLEVARKVASERINARERQLAGFDHIKFTAADGREVDLAKLRGKVVLVDFWATWCGPCIAELPNVVEAYRKYHDKGFEVIGITLESSQLHPTDSPEDTARRIESARVKMLTFTKAHGMPWPQYFDGKFWKNEISTFYGINAIPAMFLIDQKGRLVSTDARGEKLESEVKRLLGL